MEQAEIRRRHLFTPVPSAVSTGTPSHEGDEGAGGVNTWKSVVR
jgi:hypothetical protein